MEPKKILIIDDDDAIRESLEQLLQFEGMTTHSASHGQEGIDVLKSGVIPNLILLDLMMPVMNGWEFLAAIKNCSKWSQFPVLVITAAGDRVVIPNTVDGYMRKPLNVELLLREIQRLSN